MTKPVEIGIMAAMRRSVAAIFIGVLALSGLLSGAASQESDGVPDRATVQRRLDGLSGATGLDDATREGLRSRYTRALEALDRAKQHAEERERFERAVATADEEVKKAKAGVQAIGKTDPAAEADQIAALAQDALDSQVTAMTADLDRLKSESADIDKLAWESRGRPDAIAAELSAATASLRKESESPVVAAADASPLGEADRLLSAAVRHEVEMRLKRLESDRASIAERTRILDARREWVAAQFAQAEKRLEMAATIRAGRLKKQAEVAGKQAERASAAQDPEVARLAREVQKFSDELARTVERQNEVEAVFREISEARKSVDESASIIRALADSAAGGEFFSEALLEERFRMPGLIPEEVALKRFGQEMGDVRLRAYRIAEAKRSIRETASPRKTGEKLGSEALDMEAKRRDLVLRLDEEYARLTRRMAALDSEDQLLREAVGEYRRWLDRKLFSVRSLPTVGMETLAAAGSIREVLAGRSLIEGLRDATVRTVRSRPVAAGAISCFVLLLMGFRRKFRTIILHTGQQIRRIKEDTFGRTLIALFLTALRVAPVPAAIYASGAMLQAHAGGDWRVAAIGFGFEKITPYVAVAFAFFEVLMPKGLGEAHFRWAPGVVGIIRRHVPWYFSIQTVCLCVVAVIFGASDRDHGLQETGRLAYMIGDTALLVFLIFVFRPKDGVFAGALAANPDGWLARLSGSWYSAIVGLPVAMLVLAGSGYYFAALKLRDRFGVSVRFMFLAILGYALIYRWISIRQRKLALQQAIEEQQERAENVADGALPASGDAPPDVEEPEMDLSNVTRQTVTLLRFGLFAVSVGGLWSIWSSLVPALSGVGPGWAVGGVPVNRILSGFMLALVTAVTAKNLPGVLEIAVLQNLPIRRGTRYAISTLSQYAVVGTGVVLTLNVLGLDPSKLGWIVAALSVGLGFGLQEVVANFVCGIILLFERPVRVGDIVTIGEISGTVSRINIRATTVTDWDRKEFIVPNKEFIAGKLMNWTLSNSVNRMTLKVGIAYGSDTARAEAVILDIVKATPDVLADPSPFVTFDSFGDSSLNLLVRYFLPDLENRMTVQHQINCEIHRRFREEGIEIPFPQRDLHIRSSPEPQGN